MIWRTPRPRVTAPCKLILVRVEIGGEIRSLTPSAATCACVQANFIVWGGIAGGIFFQEFNTLHEGPAGWGGWPIYLFGLTLIMVGLYLVRPDVSDAPAEDAKPQSGDYPSGTQMSLPAKHAMAPTATPAVRTAENGVDSPPPKTANAWVAGEGDSSPSPTVLGSTDGNLTPSSCTDVTTLPAPSQQY